MGNSKSCKDDPNQMMKDNELSVKTKAIAALIEEADIFTHRLQSVARRIHREIDMSPGLRCIPLDLARHGSQTVPQIARSIAVTRQHIQLLVNHLAEDGYVEFVENPAHKRSPLVQLTTTGKELVNEINRREVGLFSNIGNCVEIDEIIAASKVIRALSESFEGREY